MIRMHRENSHQRWMALLPMLSLFWSSAAAPAEQIFFECQNTAFINFDGVAAVLSDHFKMTLRFDDPTHVSLTVPGQAVCQEMRGAATDKRVLVYCEKVRPDGAKNLHVLSIDLFTGEFRNFYSIVQPNDFRYSETKTLGNCRLLHR